MKLTLLFGASNALARKQAMSEIKNLILKNEKVFVVAPDRMALLTELEILNNIGSAGTINLEVLSLNTLAEKLVSQNKQTLSSFGGVLLVKKLLTENRQNLVCFNKMVGSINFASQLYKTIEQFKSSNILVDEIKNSTKNLPKGVALKLKDIALIWERYDEEIKNNFSDGFSNMSALAKAVKNSDEVEGANFVFLNFGGATSHAQNVLFAIIKKAKHTFFALPKPGETNQNAQIYDTSLESKLKGVALDERIPLSEKQSPCTFSLENKLYSFSLGQKKETLNKIALKACENVYSEVDECANHILNSVADGKKFDNFNVCVCDSELYFPIIKKVFENYKIPFFVDQTHSIKNHSLVKFILAILNCLKFNFQSTCVLEVVKNYYFDCDIFDVSQFENYVFQHGVEGGMFFSDFSDEKANEVRKKLLPLIDYYKNFKESTSVEIFIDVIRNILEQFEFREKTEKLLNELEKTGDIKNAKITNQIIDKVDEVFADVLLILKNENCSLDEFMSIFMAGFEAKEVSIVPLETGSVFVGDVYDSFFDSSKTNYVLGASIGSFPKNIVDVGIISDEESDMLKIKNKLDPSIKLLNKRALFKTFETCLSEGGLVLSFAKNSGDQTLSESLTAIDIKNIFDIKTQTQISFLPLEKLKNQKMISQNQIDECVSKNLFKLNSNKNIEEFGLLNVFEKFSKINYCALSPLKEKVDISLGTNEFSVTGLERYFVCPMKHFLSNVLYLKQRKGAIIQSLDIGNIYHQFVYYFASQIDRINEKNLSVKCQEIFEKVLLDDSYQYLLENVQNKLIIENLKKEVKKIASALLFYHKNSLFKPKFLEKDFGCRAQLKAPIIHLKNKNFFLRGKVDRIDVCQDDARVIDYKTGSDEFSLKQIYYGKKIQLIAYLMCAKENGYNPVGAYYFPISSKFKKKSFAFTLDGITLNQLSVIKNMDTSLSPIEKSKMLNVKLTKTGEIDKTVGQGGLFSAGEIEKLLEYVEKLIANAILEIEQGNISPSPLSDGKSACEFCEFRGMPNCFNAKVRLMKNVTKDELIGGDKNEQ